MSKSNSYSYEEQWTKPAIRIGRIAIILIAISSFLPNIYLYVKYGVFPKKMVAFNAWLSVAATYGAFYFIEPFSYFPIFGTAGSYLAITTGNMVNLKLPASATAQEVLGVENGTKKGEVVSMLGISGSIITNLIFITISVLLGATALHVLPKPILTAFEKFTMPALFGALYGQMTLGEYKIGLYALPISLIMLKFMNIPSWMMIIIAIFGNTLITRILYKKDIIK